MLKKIRRGVFETNSSSSHCLIIYQQSNLKPVLPAADGSLIIDLNPIFHQGGTVAFDDDENIKVSRFEDKACYLFSIFYEDVYHSDHGRNFIRTILNPEGERYFFYSMSHIEKDDECDRYIIEHSHIPLLEQVIKDFTGADRIIWPAAIERRYIENNKVSWELDYISLPEKGEQVNIQNPEIMKQFLFNPLSYLETTAG